jgi:hypothetical protein
MDGVWVQYHRSSLLQCIVWCLRQSEDQMFAFTSTEESDFSVNQIGQL